MIKQNKDFSAPPERGPLWNDFCYVLKVNVAKSCPTLCILMDYTENWSGQPVPSPVDLPNSGIEPGSPVLHADSLPTELSGKPTKF